MIGQINFFSNLFLSPEDVASLSNENLTCYSISSSDSENEIGYTNF
jgi:hypothetical protein